MAKKKTITELTHELIIHMLEKGWEINHEYLGNFKDDEVDFEKLILGLQNNKYHLVANVNDEVFVAKFESKRLKIWRMKPSWRKIGNWPVGQVILTDDGFKYSKQTGIAIEETIVVIPRKEEEND